MRAVLAYEDKYLKALAVYRFVIAHSVKRRVVKRRQPFVLLADLACRLGRIGKGSNGGIEVGVVRHLILPSLVEARIEKAKPL
jgi:hypothetical protein